MMMFLSYRSEIPFRSHGVESWLSGYIYRITIVIYDRKEKKLTSVCLRA